jgi:hypothetical protein
LLAAESVQHPANSILETGGVEQPMTHKEEKDIHR